MTIIKPPLRRRQNNNRQVYPYIILLILIVIFFATVGVQLVVKTSLFFAGFNKTEEKNVDEISMLIEPEINGLPDATNSARIFIEGRASENSIIEVYVNEDKVEESRTPDGTFTLEIGLNSGENSVYVRSLNDKKTKSKDSQVYKVVYIDKKPEISINSPTDGVEVDKEEITVKGTVTPNVIIKINGLPTIVNTNGEYTRVVQLTEGENTITVQATDLAGNTLEKQIKVIYRKN